MTLVEFVATRPPRDGANALKGTTRSSAVNATRLHCGIEQVFVFRDLKDISYFFRQVLVLSPPDNQIGLVKFGVRILAEPPVDFFKYTIVYPGEVEELVKRQCPSIPYGRSLKKATYQYLWSA